MNIKKHDYEYLDLVSTTLDTGTQKGDRTGTGTISTFGHQMRFDISDGSVPILTTKKMHLRSILHEICWYMRGETSSYELENEGVRIWKEWCSNKGELGPIYGAMWRSWKTDTISAIPKIKVDKQEHIYPKWAKIPHNTSATKKLVNATRQTNECGKITVVDVYHTKRSNGETTYNVQFANTGFVKTDVRKTSIDNGNVMDPYEPRVYGVGYLGEYDKNDIHLKQLQSHWYKILERCYDTSVESYYRYGAIGVFVDEHWFNFANFQKDAKKLANWNDKRQFPKGYDLDKDYYQSKCYSLNTCVWLSREENTLYRRNPDLITMTTPDGRVKQSLSARELAAEFDLSESLVYRCLTGKINDTKGFTFTSTVAPEGTQFRKDLPIDQIAEALHQIKTNPNNRRIIITGWDPSLLPDTNKSFDENVTAGKQALPPCHMLAQFYVADGKLSCKLTQRSADIGLGVPFNIAQYSIMTHMMARCAGLKPGEFIWSGGDCHVYNNHIEKLQEQLTRKPFPSPTLVLADRAKMEDFEFEDFSIVEYGNHATIKMSVAI